jgi:hypothetical protein
MPQLPDDLTTLGDRLTQAAAVRALENERRRRRTRKLTATGIAAALALIALAPGPLSPAVRNPFQLAAASTAEYYVPAACDQPRGATMSAARPCNPPGTTDSPPGSLARRLAGG